MRFDHLHYELAATPGDYNVLVIAGAGAGKTTVLTERVLRLLEQEVHRSGYNPEAATSVLRGLALMTFTRAAATELQERVRGAVLEHRRNAVDEKARACWTRVRDDLDEAHIGTIDSFCRSLVFRYPEEAGIAPGFTDIDEILATTALHKAARETLEEAFQEGADKALQEAAVRIVEHYPFAQAVELLESAASPNHYNGVQMILSPGQTERIQEICLELREQFLGDCSVSILRDLRKIAAIRVDAPRNKTEEKCAAVISWSQSFLNNQRYLQSDTLLTPEGASAFGSFHIAKGLVLPGNIKTNWKEEYRDLINALRVEGDYLNNSYGAIDFTPAEAIEAIRPELEALQILAVKIRDRYTAWKRENAVLDFADLIERAYSILARKEILEECRERYRHIWIDEFQDTSRAQASLLFSLAGEPGQPRFEADSTNENYRLAPGKFFAVGDPKQSIYRFREADVTVFEETRLRIEAEGGKVIPLEQNYRSEPSLVAHHNDAFDLVFATPRHPFEAYAQQLEAARPADPQKSPRVSFVLHGDPEAKSNNLGVLRSEEAIQVARLIKAIVEVDRAPRVFDRRTSEWRAPEYRDIALLFQVGTNLPVYEEALRRAGIPYYIHAGRGFFSVEELTDLLHALSLLRNPSDDVSQVGWLRSPMVGLSDAGLHNLSHFQGPWVERLRDAVQKEQSGQTVFTLKEDTVAARLAVSHLETLLALRGAVTLPELLRRLLDETAFGQVILAAHHGDQKRANIEKVLALAEDFAGNQNFGLDDFIDLLQDRRRGEDRQGEASLSSEEEPCITLMTIHRAKGLEFPIVLLPDLVRQGRGNRDPLVRHRLIGTVPRKLEDKMFNSTGTSEDDGDDRDTQPLVQLIQLLETREENAERRRVLYVASTRARDALYYFIPQSKIAELADKPPVREFDFIDLRRMLADSHGLVEAQSDNNKGAEWQILGGREPLEDEDTFTAGSLFDRERETLAAGLPLKSGSERAARPIVERCIADFRNQARQRAFHTTALLTYNTCPKRYAFKYIHGLPEYGALAPAMPPHLSESEEPDSHEPDEDHAAEAGILVHAVLAEMDFNNSGNLEDHLLRTMAGIAIPLSPEEVERCRRNIQWVLEGGFGRRLSWSARLLRETDFRVRVGEGAEEVFILGRMDGLVLENDLWTVFDYKTNRQNGRPEWILERYRTQLEIYRMAARKSLGADSINAELVLTDYETILTIDPDPDYGVKILPELLNRLLNEDYTPAPTPNCHKTCPYARLCEAVADRFVNEVLSAEC